MIGKVANHVGRNMSSKKQHAHKQGTRKGGVGVTNKAAVAAGIKPIYRQVDKLEFYFPDSQVETGDKPTKSHLVSIPITDKEGTLRYQKINSIKVHIWNRGANDIYLEVMQPFGAHDNPQTIVAWAPVKGRKRRPQTKWTMKANKSGGQFFMDVSDNSLTLPAVAKITESSVDYLHLQAFAFALTRNAASFTGSEGGKSSRAFQVKMIVDFVGPKSETPKAVIRSGDYNDMGAVSKYPLKDTATVFKQMGMIPAWIQMGLNEPDIVLSRVQYNGSMKSFFISNNDNYQYKLEKDQKLFYLTLNGFDSQLEKAKMSAIPIYPIPGLVLRRNTVGNDEHVIGTGFGDYIVKDFLIHPTVRPPNEGWYVCRRIIEESGFFEDAYMPVMAMEQTDTGHFSYMYTQYAEGLPVIRFSEMIPFNDGLHMASLQYCGGLRQRKDVRVLVGAKPLLLSKGGVKAFSILTFIEIVTVIIKVIEAAYAEYQKYSPSAITFKSANDHLHADFQDEGFCVLNEIE